MSHPFLTIFIIFFVFSVLGAIFIPPLLREFTSLIILCVIIALQWIFRTPIDYIVDHVHKLMVAVFGTHVTDVIGYFLLITPIILFVGFYVWMLTLFTSDCIYKYKRKLLRYDARKLSNCSDQ